MRSTGCWPTSCRRRVVAKIIVLGAGVFRTYLASRCCLTSVCEAISDQDLLARVTELARDSDPPSPAGSDRAQLLSILNVVAA
jgi:hypothetical protein